MKKHFYFLLMAALVFGLSLSVTSCKDDDKDNNGNGNEDQETYEGLSTLENMDGRQPRRIERHRMAQ